MNETEIVLALTPLIEVLEELGVAYHIGGSVASSVHGIRRETQDVDVVADLQSQHVHPLVKQIEMEYYIDADAVRDAIRHRSSFNAIHNDTMLKVDVFIPKSRQFSRHEQLRAQQEALAPDTRPFYLSSPEDMVLNKLEWYRMGGETSTRQWNDILGMLKVQGAALDLAYMQQWAVSLRVTDLLERVLAEAGLKEQ